MKFERRTASNFRQIKFDAYKVANTAPRKWNRTEKRKKAGGTEFLTKFFGNLSPSRDRHNIRNHRPSKIHSPNSVTINSQTLSDGKKAALALALSIRTKKRQNKCLTSLFHIKLYWDIYHARAHTHRQIDTEGQIFENQLLNFIQRRKKICVWV